MPVFTSSRVLLDLFILAMYNHFSTLSVPLHHPRLLQAPSLSETSPLAIKPSLPLATTWSRSRKRKRRTLRAEKLLLDPIRHCTSEEPNNRIDGADIRQDNSSETDQEGELSEEGSSGGEEGNVGIPEKRAGQLSKQELPQKAVAVAPEEQDDDTAAEKRSAMKKDGGSVPAVVEGEGKTPRPTVVEGEGKTPRPTVVEEEGKTPQPTVYVPVDRSPDMQVCDCWFVVCVHLCVHA